MSNKLTTIEIARKKLLDSIQISTTKTKVTLQKSLMRISCNLIESELNLPSTANSAVDGYGISSKTYFSNPKTKFIVIGVAKAGHPFNEEVGFGQAIEIYTGAVMPKGIDTIIMHEKCNRVGDEVIIKDIIKKNQNMRPVGENLRKGEIVVKKGKLLNAADIGQLAASGNGDIEVYKKLTVSIISTGDELIDPLSKNKLKGQIFDSNKPMLMSLLSLHYLKVLDLGIVKDNRTQLTEKYAEALTKSDVVISSGGASDGIEDHTQNALKDIGAKCLVWQLAMKPGKPMAIGMLGKKIIFCLPGNPVAAFVCTKLLINPILMKLAGGTDWDPLSFKLPAGFDHQKRNGRAEFLRAKIINKDQRSFVYLHGRKGAGVISSLTGADGIVEIPLESETVSKGDFLKFYPFDYRGL